MDKEKLTATLREQLSVLLEHEVSSGPCWQVSYNGAWTPARWIGWVTLQSKNIELDWPLDDNNKIDTDLNPWLSIKVHNRGSRLLSWLVPEQWHTLGAIGIDKGPEFDGPWWDRLQLVSETMRTQIESLPKAESENTEGVIEARAEESSRRKLVVPDIEALKKNFS